MPQTRDARILFETHSHTPLCKHATGEPTEYAEVAWSRGLRGLTVTCHNPMPDRFSAHVRMDESELDEYVRIVAAARAEWAGRIDVRLGLECDFFPGYEAYVDRQLKLADFHYVLGSVHPQVREYRERFRRSSAIEYQETYFGHLAEAAETGLFDCISHPDLVKNETVEEWDPAPILDVIRSTLDRIAKTGVAMELNTSGVNKKIPEMNPFPEMLREMRRRDIPVVVGADAHEPDRVGDGFLEALDLLETCGYSEVNFFLDRKRQAIPIEAARNSLQAFTETPRYS